MKKCVYCHKETNDTTSFYKQFTNLDKNFYFCNEECAEKSSKFYSYVKKWCWLFLVNVTLTVVLLSLSMIFESYVGILFCISLSLSGLTLILFPFATQITIDMLGVKKTLIFCRVIGSLFILLAPFCLFMNS